MEAGLNRHSGNITAVIDAAHSRFANYHLRSCREDLYLAIEYYRQAFSDVQDDFLRLNVQIDLSLSLFVRFQDEENFDDIQECTDLAEEALVKLREDDARRARCLRILGYALATWADRRPEKAGDVLERALECLRTSVQLTEKEKSDEATLCLFQCGHALKINSRHRSEDLHASLRMLNIAIHMTPRGHHLRPYTLFYGAYVRWSLFARTSDLSCLHESLDMTEEAVVLMARGHRQRPIALNVLGCLHYTRYITLGDETFLDSALKYIKLAVDELPAHNVLKISLQGNYFETLLRRYTARSQLLDLDSSIAGLRSVLHSLPSQHVFRYNYTSCLGRALEYAYAEYGKSALLDAAVDLHKDAVSTAPPETLYYCYRNLAESYHSRFLAHKHRADLDQAISLIRTAQAGCHEKAFLLGLFSSLGDFFTTRFTLLGLREDIDEAICALQHKIDLMQGQQTPYSAETRSLLGHAFLQRFIAFRHLDDLTNAISQHEEAILHFPENYIILPTAYARLGSAHMLLFETTRMVAEIQNALTAYKRAVEITRKGRSIRATYLSQLGTAQYELSRITQQPSHTFSALEVLREAAEDKYSSVAARFQAAMKWASIAHDENWLDWAVVGYQLAVQLLPQVAWLGLDHTSRMQRLAHDSGDSCQDACACAIALGQLELAVEMLDRGRSIIWNASQNLRIDLSGLRLAHPGLAQEFQEISAALDSRALQRGPPLGIDQEQDARSHRRLADRWQELLELIRTQSGFENFLTPLPFAELRKAAQGGVIVVVNISAYRCDALLIWEDRPVHLIPLPEVRWAEIRGTAYTLDTAVRAMKDIRGQKFLDGVLLRTLRNLWEVLGRPIWNAVSSLTLAHSTPHVWWCLTGALSRLPVHACGAYDGMQKGMADVVISSYTPTLSGLMRAKLSRSCLNSNAFDMLAVGIQAIPGVKLSALPCATEELGALRALFPNGEVTFLEGSEATICRVSAFMRTKSWLHVATHGVQRPDLPLDSHLLLHDGPLYLSAIAQSHLPRAEFAFLSACHSAKGHEWLPDEALHMAGGLLLAGSKGVVATLWSIVDEDGPRMARLFYGHLTRNGGVPDVMEAAEALHKATVSLRQTSAGLSRWVPFVHLGL